AKTRPIFEDSNKARLIIKPIENTQSCRVQFIVPGYIYRHSTSLNDYFIIRTKKKSYQFANQVNSLPINNDQIFDVVVSGLYVFETDIKRALLQEIVNEQIKKVIFFFTPNSHVKDGVEKIYKGQKLDGLDKHIIMLSKRKIRVAIKEPNLAQMKDIQNFIAGF
ncbi:hypothetical protein, partial [Dolichospermum circinale]|uniref:hypothetical protein n=1 Tax=Dolichospermum circinale TaxID=109265 RepID=UPI00232DD5F9